MSGTAYTEKNRRIQLGNESMRSAMFRLVLALVAAIALWVVSVMLLYNGNLVYGLPSVLASMVLSAVAVKMGRRYKEHRSDLDRFMERNPSVYKKDAMKFVSNAESGRS